MRKKNAFTTIGIDRASYTSLREWCFNNELNIKHVSSVMIDKFMTLSEEDRLKIYIGKDFTVSIES